MSNCPGCGLLLDGEKTRSYPHLKRYMAMIAAVYSHWPETHAEQFASVEECRAFLQMRAGHRIVAARIPLTGMKKEAAVMLATAAIRATGGYAVPRVHGNELVVFAPKSIAFGRLGHKKATALFNEVDAVILDETGRRGSEYLAKEDAAA